MNNPFDYTPEAECNRAFRQLLERIERLRSCDDPAVANFLHELDAGKMLGVMIASDTEGRRHTLYAFSGQLASGGFSFEGFVEPVFDYLDPAGHFMATQADISRRNIDIARFESEVLAKARRRYDMARSGCDRRIQGAKNQYILEKQRRQQRRLVGEVSAAEEADMVRASQYEKACLHRLKKQLAKRLQPFDNALRLAERQLQVMKEKRRNESEALQQWLFDNFSLLNARGQSRSLSEIFADTPMRIPPSGAGECCGPKLLQAAYRRGWHPEAMAEYWYGRPKSGQLRFHGRAYPACRGKCLPVLQWMLQGVAVESLPEHTNWHAPQGRPEILFENQWFCVVNKPAGMLSVPGKEAVLSVEQWLAAHYGSDCQIRMAHRLDQATSGIIVATFGTEAYRLMQALFARREVSKTYIADLDGDYRKAGLQSSGHIDLPLSADWLDRPRQVVDRAVGKPAATDYEFVEVAGDRSRVVLHPLTGRTHQLRVHAASPEGLGMSIAGDRLYGREAKPATRLHLHACRLEFTWPLDGRHYCFEVPVPFNLADS